MEQKTKTHNCPDCGCEITVSAQACKNTLCQTCRREHESGKNRRNYNANRQGDSVPGIAPKRNSGTEARIKAIGEADAAWVRGEWGLAIAICDDAGLAAMAAKYRKIMKAEAK